MAKQQDEDIEQQAAPEPQEDRLSVDVTEQDDDADEGPGQPQQQAGDRKGRRAGYRAIKDELATERTKREQLERDIAELRGRVSAPVPQPVQAPVRQEPEGPDEIDAIAENQQLILQALANPKLSDAQQKELTQRWNKLDRQKNEAMIRKYAPQPPRSPQVDPEVAAGAAALSAQYPDVMGDEIKRDEARLEQRKLIRAGRPNNLATALEAAKRVSERTNGRPPAPTDADRSKHAGTPTRAGASGAGGTWTPNKQQLRNALAYCDTEQRRNLDDSEKLRLWYHEVGKKAGVV